MPNQEHAETTTCENVISVWSAVVKVQMHFNDICMRIRALAIVAVAALLSASGFVEGIEGSLTFSQCCLISIAVCVPFYIVDRMWYHRLLLAAVKHGKAIEHDNDHLRELRLASLIGNEVPSEWSANCLTGFYVAISIALIFVLN